MRSPLRPHALLALLLALGLPAWSACSDDETAPPATVPDAGAEDAASSDAAPTDASDDTTSGDDAATRADTLNEDAATDADPTDADPADAGPVDLCSPDIPPEVWLLSEVTVGRIASGVSNGFDLNVRSGYDTTCGKRTFRRPDGTPGINNQFGTLMPAIELTELGALEALIQTAINDGFLLLMVEMERLADPVWDECVDLRILNGQGEPIVGNDQRVLSGLTFERAPDGVLGEALDLTIEDGMVEAGPFDLQIQFVFFGNDILLNSYQSWVHFQLRPDGTAFGYIGGALSVPELIDFAMGINDGGDIGLQLARFLEGAADLFPNEEGECEHLSIVLEFEARPAFFYE